MSIRRLLMAQGDPMAEVEGLTPLSVVLKKNRVANDYNIYGHDGIVMNQYFKENDSYKFSECSIKIEENIVTATWTEASTNLQSNVYKEKTCKLNKGIKLFYRFSIMAKDDNVKLGMIAFPATSTTFDTTRNIQLSPNKWISHSGIATIGVDTEKLIMAVTAQRANVLIISSYSVKDVNIINLTQMFGAGNEPTSSDEFAQRLGYNSIDDVPYIPYNEGEIAGVGDKQQDGTYKIPVNVRGKNLIDNQWVIGGIVDGTGEEKASVTNLRTANYLYIDPSKTYYMTKPNHKIWVYQYDGSSSYIGWFEVNSGEFTFDSRCKKIKFMLSASYGTTYNNDVYLTNNPYHNETINIYTKTPLLKGDYTSFNEQKVLRTDGTSEDVTIPPLELAQGTNIIDVETIIKPEKISVKARGIKPISV